MKIYYVAIDGWIDFPDGGGRNYVPTRSARHAMRVLKKNPKHGQIDVRDRNMSRRKFKPYCMAYWDHGRIIRQEPL